MTFPKLRLSRCPRWLALLLAVAGGVGAWRLGEELLTRRAFARGVAALAAGDNAAAREQFERCQAFWGHVPAVQFYAAQAARRDGDGVAAAGLLKAAEDLGWDADELALERALIAATAGIPFPQVEPALRATVMVNSTSAPEAFTLLGTKYLGQFRLGDAEGLCAAWIEKHPDDLGAWRLRAEVLERLNRKPAAREAYARWAELDPTDRKARVGLIRMMVATRAPSPVLLEQFEKFAPGEAQAPDLLPYWVQTLMLAGKSSEATAALDRVIAAGNGDPSTYMYRAKVELDRGDPAAALPFARKAVEIDDSAVEALFTLLQCLQQTGATAEAQTIEARWRTASKDLDRANELARTISARPFDPDLRREMGEVYLRHGLDAEGIRWLESALAIDPSHAATHRVLADYFARVGRPEQAAAHRAKSKP